MGVPFFLPLSLRVHVSVVAVCPSLAGPLGAGLWPRGQGRHRQARHQLLGAAHVKWQGTLHAAQAASQGGLQVGVSAVQ